jgi:hypothetical protein
LDQFFGGIDLARFELPKDPVTGKTPEQTITGFTDSKKLMPGAGDYYKVLERMGDPIRRLEEALGTETHTPQQKKILELGKRSAFLVSIYRLKDFDEYRPSNFKNYFAKIGVKDFIPEFKDVTTGRTNEVVKIIDWPATKEKYKDELDKEKFNDAQEYHMRAQRNGNLINVEHDKALKAANRALERCGCGDLIQTPLRKKRSVNRTANWGGPLAARSKQMKAYELAQMVQADKVL